MAAPTTDELNQRHRSRIEAFVLRARRVKEHSLYKDYDELLRVGKVTLEIEPDEAGQLWMTQTLPPEELVESAAARVRPLILQDEDSCYKHTLAALGWFLRGVDHQEVRRVLDSLKKEWAEFDSKGRTTLAYSVQMGRVGEAGPDQPVADNVLAFAWIYGDVVHGDRERLAETALHGVKERYRAAAPLVCRLIQQTAATLHVIEWLIGLGLIAVSDEVFKREVVVPETVFREKVIVRHAEYTDEMPPIPSRFDDPFDDRWQILGKPSEPDEVKALDMDEIRYSEDGLPD